MAKLPERKTAEASVGLLARAPRRGDGTYGIGVPEPIGLAVVREAVPDAPESSDRPAETELTVTEVAVEVAPAAASPTPVTLPKKVRRSKPKPQRVDTPAPAVALETTQIGDPWSQFDLPQLVAPEAPVFELKDLVSGSARITTMFLPGRVADALRQLKFEFTKRHIAVTQGTIVCHAMAYGYVHSDQWLDLTPMDGRRREAETSLSTRGRRTSFGLTYALRDATDALLWYAVTQAGERAPAKLTIQATALAWGLAHRDKWLDNALENPVVVLSEDEEDDTVDADT